ncbi:MAG: methionyl aminopeptidase [Candidatus Berkelbacteria bacterium Licking1014_7]|uniref:Methionine aminopeptidase n=1 Tax=Candidatus Berkelbacteria bacterium Licking1014_7 TaxID=2017147 RepID=A0A554LI52_9BACT|nr:MAG: methionyl aminopeptidase [Candidatus Berkelbacteria bacterium Licking1014_7]
MNKVNIYSHQEIEKIKTASKILMLVFKEIQKLIIAGAKEIEIEQKAKKIIQAKGAQPAFLGFNNYPYVTCVSVNSELVHSPPTRYKFKQGDIVSVDIGVEFNGYCADKAATFAVGKISNQNQKLINTCQAALSNAIKIAKSNKKLGDISSAIQKTIEKENFGIIKELAGHGVGKKIHEAPMIFNFGKPDTGIILKPGMVLAIEPMISAGEPKTQLQNDGWTISTKDKSNTVHFEETIVITKNGCQILTQ